jgi:saccharopine dehydrogenase-like NADP-dependent oxidoreductase
MRIAVIGAGRVGRAIATLLADSGDYRVTLADRRHPETRVRAAAVRHTLVDASAPEGLERLFAGHDAVISAAPFDLTVGIARAAHAAGIHYLDLTEDVASTREVATLGEDARAAMIPQCGLAPGFISIVGMDLARRFDELDDLRLRVGALPRFPNNRLLYNLTWSTAGIVNEYCEPCHAIADGHRVTTPALAHLERFSLDGVAYEAFNTSGGLGSLCDTLDGRVRNLDYKSIRYPGHRDAMKLLLDDLRLAERRELLTDILEHALPTTRQDVVVLFASAVGRRAGRLVQESYAKRVYAGERGRHHYTAIELTTGASVCAVLDLLRDGRLPQRGLVRQEEIGLELFLANRFGRVYAPEPDPEHSLAA